MNTKFNDIYFELICEENENLGIFDKIKNNLSNVGINSINPVVLFKCINEARTLSKDDALNFLNEFKKITSLILEDTNDSQSLEKNVSKTSSFFKFIKKHDKIFSYLIPFYDGLITEEELKVLPAAIKSIVTGNWRIKFIWFCKFS